MKPKLSPFAVIAAYVDPTSIWSYATVVLSDGVRLAATDGYGMIAVHESKPAGAYTQTGEASQVKVPGFGSLLDQAYAAPARPIDATEFLAETIWTLPKKSKFFVGIPKAAGGRVIVIAGEPSNDFGYRTWFSANMLKKWFGADKFFDSIFLTEDQLLGERGLFRYLLMSVEVPKTEKK